TSGVRVLKRAASVAGVVSLLLAGCSSGGTGGEQTTTTSLAASTTTQLEAPSTTTSSVVPGSAETGPTFPYCEEIETLATWFVQASIAQLELKKAARTAADAADMNVFRDGVVTAMEAFDPLADAALAFYENESELKGLSGLVALVVAKARQDVHVVGQAMLDRDDEAVTAALVELDNSPHSVEAAEGLREGLSFCPLAESNVAELAG